MSIQVETFVVVRCDDCKTRYVGYEETPLLFDTVDEFQNVNAEEETHLRWVVDEDSYLCADCACKRDGHPLDPEQTFTAQSGEEMRYCRCGCPWPPGRGLGQVGEQKEDRDG